MELKQIEIKDWLDQFTNLTDRTLVGEKCWSELSIKSRLWNYAQMITHGLYEISEVDKPRYAKLVESLEKERCIILWGNPGTGKSTLTKIISKITHHITDKKRFKFVSAYTVADQFSKSGSDIFSTYAVGNWIFDDVGLEKNMQIKGGGNSYNVFEQLIYQLSDLHLNPNIKSKFILSTNLDEEQLRERYGDRVMSRLNQIADFIKINGTDNRTKDIRIEVFPEVMHPPKSDEGIPMPPHVREAVNGLVKAFSMEETKQRRSKPLSPTEFELACWDHFDKEWKAQGEPRMNGGANYIVHDGKEYNRQSFVEMVRQLKEAHIQ